MRDFAKLGRDAHAELPRVGAVALLAGLGLTLIGPFGTDKWDIFVRLGFWTAMSAAWFVVTYAIAFGFNKVERLRQLTDGQRWLRMFAVTLIPGMVIAAGALRAVHGVWLKPREIVELLGQLLVIGIVLEVFNRALYYQPAPGRPQAAGEDQGTAAPRIEPSVALPPEPYPAETYPVLLRRLPPHTRAPIICLQMEDHYVRVHTEADSTLVLMRFSDALSEVDSSAGLRVHRSWWVASEAVRCVTRTGRIAQLELNNALKVPVSQPYLAAVAALAEQRQLKTVYL